MTIPGAFPTPTPPPEEPGFFGQAGDFLGAMGDALVEAPLADLVPGIADVRSVYRGLTQEGMGTLERTFSLLPLVVGTVAGLGGVYRVARGATRSIAEAGRMISVAPNNLPYGARVNPPDMSQAPSPESAYAYAARYSETGQGPFARTQAAVNYEDLAGHITGRAADEAPINVVADLAHVGVKLVGQTTVRPYAGTTPPEQQMNATRHALARMENVMGSDAAGIDPLRESYGRWIAGEASDADRMRVTKAMVFLEEGLRDVAGPDMVFAPFTALQGFVPGTNRPVISYSSMAVRNPRVVDPTTGHLPDIEGLTEASNRLHPQSVVGEMAGNIINIVKNKVTPEEYAEFSAWWQEFHDLVRGTSDLTGVDLGQVSAAFASMSAVARWNPDNILAGLHMTLQHALPDLLPSSDEYQAIIKKLLTDSGWWDRVITGKTFKPHMLKANFAEQLKGRTGGKGGLTILNKGMAKAAKLVQGMPWQQQMKALKTRKMAMLGENPKLPDDAVIDRHDFTMLMGFYTGNTDPPQFNSPMHYQSMEQAHILSRDVMGDELASTGQAVGWKVIQDDSEDLGFGTQRIGAAREVYSMAIPNLIEQSDVFAPNPVSMTERVSSKVTGPFPAEDPILRGVKDQKRGGNMYDHDHHLLIAMGEDGVSVYLPKGSRGGEDKLRHLFVSPFTNGKHNQMLPRSPAKVIEMDEVRQAQSGGNELRSLIPQGGSTHPALEHGTAIYVEVDSPESLAVIKEAIGPHGVYELVESQIEHSQAGFPSRNLSEQDLTLVNDANFASGAPLRQNDWVALTSQKGERSDANWDRYLELRQRVRDMGYEFHTVDGRYDVEEDSILVFGMKYSDAVKLGEEFDQESVATAAGLIYTTGPNKGKMHRALSDHKFGKEAVDSKNYSTVEVGKRKVSFSWDYEWDKLSPIDDINALAPSGRVSGPRTGLTIKMGHAASWRDINAITGSLKHSGRTSSISAYVTGQNLVPDGYVPAYDTLYLGPNKEILSVRSKSNPGMDNPNVYKTYVSPEEWLGLGDGAPSSTPRVKVTDEVKNVMLVDGQVRVAYIGPEGNAQVVTIAKGNNQLRGTIDGKRIKAAFVGSSGVYVFGAAPKVPPPDGVFIKVSKGVVTSMSTTDPAQVHDAVRTLRRLGVEVSDEVADAAVVTVMEQSQDLNLSVEARMALEEEWFAQGGMTTDQVRYRSLMDSTKERFRVGKVAVSPNAEAQSAKLSELLGVTVKVNFSTKFSDRQVNDIFQALYEWTMEGWPADIFDEGNLTYGLDDWVPRQNARIMGRVPGGEGRGGLVISLSSVFAQVEQKTPDLWRELNIQEGGGPRFNVAVQEGRSVLSTAVIHETGHLLTSRFKDLGLDGPLRHRIATTFDQLGGYMGVQAKVSLYATENWDDFFAEVLAMYHFEKADCDPAILSLMDDVQKVLKDPTAHRRFASEWGPAGLRAKTQSWSSPDFFGKGLK